MIDRKSSRVPLEAGLMINWAPLLPSESYIVPRAGLNGGLPKNQKRGNWASPCVAAGCQGLNASGKSERTSWELNGLLKEDEQMFKVRPGCFLL
jgi:hypothetical protein